MLAGILNDAQQGKEGEGGVWPMFHVDLPFGFFFLEGDVESCLCV